MYALGYLSIVALGFMLAGPATAQQNPAPTIPSETQDSENPDAGSADSEASDSATTPTDAAEPDGAAPTTGAEEQTNAPSPDSPADATETDGTTGDPAASELLEIVRDTFGDWEVRCLPEGNDCFMYQLALDPEENPVAEVSLLKLPEGNGAAAGATVVTPLGTLLTTGVVMQIDGGEKRQYPFNWCSQVGCFARFGLDDDTLAKMKRGKMSNMTLVSVGAPDTPITVPVSLEGFTAAYDSLALSK